MLKHPRVKSEFANNVLTLMTGTTIAQAIPIAATPLLTRLYSPDEFGLFAMCLSITAILSVFVTGRYELAIMQPSNETEAGHLCRLSILLTSIISSFFFLILWMVGDRLSVLIGKPEIIQFMYFIPCLTLIFGTYNSFNFLLNRKKHYSTVSRNKVFQSLITSAVSLLAGFLSMNEYGLITGLLVGYSLSTLLLIIEYHKSLPDFNLKKLKGLAKEYKSYPILDTPSSVFSIISQQMPTILFVPIFGAMYSGYYYLVERIFLSPIGLISGAIGAVFRQRALEDKKKGNYKRIFLKTFYKLVLFGTPLFLILTFYSVEIFTFLLGEDWRVAGQYAEILAPMFLMKFIVSPLSYSLYISNKLHYNLVGQFLYSTLIAISIIYGYMFDNINKTIVLISFSGIFIYLLYFAVSLKLSMEKTS